MKMEIERFDAKTEEETIIDLDIAIKEIYKCLSSSPYGFSYTDLSTEDKIKDQLLAGKDIDTFEATYCLHLINYPNCADQASIAAPGQKEYEMSNDQQKAQELIDSSEKIWWDDEKQEYNTIDYAIQKQWQQRLQTLREKSVAEINFIDALDSVITRDEYRSLTDDQQRELIQAWLYPDNDEIDELIKEIPTDVHYEPSESNLSENNEVQDLTSIEFFVANVKSYHASVFGVYCSNCFESESTIAVTTNNYTMFEFCKPCYDKLKRAMIARDARS